MMLAPHTLMVRVLVIVLFISLGMLGTTYATTYYVSKSGSDSNSCATAQSPGGSAKQTIAAGSQCLSGGDTLLIQAGTYVETMVDGQAGFSWRNGTPNNYTRYAKYQADRVIVRAPSGSMFVARFGQTTAYIEVDGLILDGTDLLGGSCGTAVVKMEGDGAGNESHHIRLKNNEIRNGNVNGNFAIGVLGGYQSEFLNNHVHHNQYGFYSGRCCDVFDGNIVHDNLGYAFHLYNDKGGIVDNVVKNNVMYRNGFATNACQPSGNAEAIVLGKGSGIGNNNLIYNNILYNNWAGIGVLSSMTNTQIYNNTFYNNTGSGGGFCISLVGPIDTTIRNNICFGNSNNNVQEVGTSGTVISHQMTSNPLFVDAANGNFRLQSGSPARDAGMTITSVPTDIAGTIRPHGSAYDIGAYELGESVSLAAPTGLRIVY